MQVQDETRSATQNAGAPPDRQRRRDTVLEVLELFRALDPQVSSLQITAFLYLCENEGISISELAFICRTSLATASRCVQTLVAWQVAVGDRRETLVDWVVNPADGRGKQLFLNEAGRMFRDRIDEIIRAAVPTRFA